MGDSGEGLIDADARIQERMEELERERTRQQHGKPVRDTVKMEALETEILATLGIADPYGSSEAAGLRKVSP